MAVIEQLGNLEYKITLNTTELERGQKKASSIMSRLDTSLGRLANLNLASQGVMAFSKRIISMGTDVIKAATTMASLERGLAAVAGGAAAADAQLIGLREVAKLPGLGLQEAVQGAVNLQAAGLSAQRATDSLKAFGNALATVGKGKAELDGVILALTQMQAKGKLSAEEINQIAERVPQIRRVMVEAFGTAIPKEIEKMGISVDDFIDKVNKQLMTLPQVVGGAANTFENLGDTIFEAKTRIGELFLPAVLSAAEAFASALGDVNRALTPLSDQVKSDIAAWDSLKTQWQAQDTEITKLVGQYNTLQTRLKAITESGGDTHAVQADLERVNKSLIELVPQLGVAYDKEKQALVGLNETLERHREAKGRMLRMAFRENLEKTTKATKEATAAEKIAIKQRDLQLYIMKRVKEESYELGEATGRFGIEIALNTATMKKATTVSQLYRDAREELGLTEEETSKSETKLRAGLKEKLGLEQALALQIGASTDKVNTYRTEIESLQGTVRSYVETTGKNNVEQFNKLVDIYSSLHDEQGKLKEITPEYTTALNKLATQVNLTGTALEQGLGAKITVVEDKLVESTSRDYNFNAKVKIPTAEEINKEIRDFEKKIFDALAMVEARAKTEGKMDLEQVVRDQLALIDSIIKAEDISEQELFTKYQGLYAKRADLREALKTHMVNTANAEASAEEKATKDKISEQTKAEKAFAAEQTRLRNKRLAGEEKAKEDLIEWSEEALEKRLAFEEELVKFMLEFQEAKTKDERDALNEQYKAFKERNALYITNNQGARDEIATIDQIASQNQIALAESRDAEIAAGAKEWQDRETADKEAALETRALLEVHTEEELKAIRDKMFKDRAAKRADLLDDWIDIWDEVGNSVVDLGYLISTDLGQNLETALNFGGAFLETMQAVQLALAGTGSWFTVAAKGIGLVTTMLSGGGFEGKNAKRRRELREEVEGMVETVNQLELLAGVGQGYWRNVGKDVERLQDALVRKNAATSAFIHGTFRNRDQVQAAQREYDAAISSYNQIEEEENKKHQRALATYEKDLKLRVAMIEDITGSLVGSITDTLADGMDQYGAGWDKVEDAIERNLMGAIFQGVLDAQIQRHELEPLVEQYVQTLTNAFQDNAISYSENQELTKKAKAIKLAGVRVKTNAERMLNSVWGFDWDDFFPKEEEIADTASLLPTVDVPEMTTGLTTSIRNITRSQADALSAVFTNISAINGRIADNTLRTADLLETYLPSISGGGMMVQTTDVGGASYVSPEYAQAMGLQNAVRANG